MTHTSRSEYRAFRPPRPATAHDKPHAPPLARGGTTARQGALLDEREGRAGGNYAAGAVSAGARAAALTSMRSGIVIVIFASRSSSQRALTIVTPITSPMAL